VHYFLSGGLSNYSAGMEGAAEFIGCSVKEVQRFLTGDVIEKIRFASEYAEKSNPEAQSASDEDRRIAVADLAWRLARYKYR
jgi:hypothetical protein